MKFLLTAAFTPLFLATHSGAAVIASTDFDARTLATTNVANDTATGPSLNWVTNGVNNPGSMVARAQNGPTGQALFDTTTLTQKMFAPALNTGNGNTFWTTNISLTVSAGSTVSLESVTFDYWAISGGGAQNVTRASDFTATLFNPSAVSVGTASINDASNGTTPGAGTPVTLTFSSPIGLLDPGTYTLQIKGGDYAGTDETGNHTGIDNLSINGTVSAVPEPASLGLSALGLACLAFLRRRPA